MNVDRARLKAALDTADRGAVRLRQSLEVDRERLGRVARGGPANASPDDLRATDAMVQRFQQMVEHLTQRLLPSIYRLEELGERPPPLRTLLRIYEDSGLIGDPVDWRSRIDLRNRLVHDYPLDDGERGNDLLAALDESERMLAALDRIHDYVIARGLIAGDDDD